ncbi:hypothetical protein H2199_008998 [Coniosporium tulheliwenetii]|uniref:Uncharacterized protein n=1 Tax=Coniosporium tulheliwenetii TaxID=3383036 RepID=A0ACC2YH46_9PEZI|nr:hypothetical protein H2199_008998 [Cladosporium sp. JES 115]
MRVNDQQQYEPEAARELLRSCSDDPADSDTPTEPDTHTENERARDASVWTGQYTFDLSIVPEKPMIGWVAGRGRGRADDSAPVKRLGYSSLPPSGGITFVTSIFTVARASGASTLFLTVNGTSVSSSPFAFNQNDAKLRIGDLEYQFEYTEYARSTDYASKKSNYLRTVLGFLEDPPPYFPVTPAPNTTTVDQWTLGSSLGSSSFGKVHAATNTKGEVVAIKTVTRQDVGVAAALQHECLLRLRDVIYQRGKKDYEPPHFENVWLILEPVARETFVQLASRVLQAAMSVENMHLFRGALRGVDRDPPQVILLDLRGAINTAWFTSRLVHPTLGVGGTVGYLAPGRELEPYNESVGVWSLRVIGYQLTYGKHPWKLARNPWRKDYVEELKPQFEAVYHDAIAKLTKSETGSVENLLAQMLRHCWTAQNSGHRISAHDALQHPCWKSLESDLQVPSKRARLDNV